MTLIVLLELEDLALGVDGDLLAEVALATAVRPPWGRFRPWESFAAMKFHVSGDVRAPCPRNALRRGPDRRLASLPTSRATPASPQATKESRWSNGLDTARLGGGVEGGGWGGGLLVFDVGVRVGRAVGHSSLGLER